MFAGSIKGNMESYSLEPVFTSEKESQMRKREIRQQRAEEKRTTNNLFESGSLCGPDSEGTKR